MDIQLLDKNLLSDLHKKAASSERLRMNFDLRTTSEDGSQRMLNALQPGTKVPIHRHLNTSETVVCLEGSLDWVFYEELPNMDAGGPIHDGKTAADESCFVETARFRICPREGLYGIQVVLCMMVKLLQMHRSLWKLPVSVFAPAKVFMASRCPRGHGTPSSSTNPAPSSRLRMVHTESNTINPKHLRLHKRKLWRYFRLFYKIAFEPFRVSQLVRNQRHCTNDCCATSMRRIAMG